MGESNAEEPQEVSIGCLDISVSLDESLPLLNHGSELIGGEVHSVEVRQAVLALDVLAQQLELLERPLGILQH